MKILITGAGGQLAKALVRRLGREHELIALNRSELNIAGSAACADVVSKLSPDLVLNCAAYTAVDRAETEHEAAFAINAAGPENMAHACNAVGAGLIHFSTDYVFDGNATRPYVETDATNPVSVYGQSKLAGETAVLAICEKAAVVRLSWVYGNDGTNFYKTMRRLAAERPVLRVVADQWGVPNYAGDIANGVAAMLPVFSTLGSAPARLFHLSAGDTTNWCEFAREIIIGAKLDDSVAVEAITTAEYPTAARRPAYSVLDGRHFAATFGWSPPNWRDGLRTCLTDKADASA